MPSRWAVACARIGLIASLALIAGRARAESWSSVFAAERDTAVFLTTDGTLLRAPFSLEGGEALWRDPGKQHVVRFVVSPGGRIAWIVRGADDDTTRLWLTTDSGVQEQLRYVPILPSDYGQTSFEPDVPTTADHGVRGARLVQASSLIMRHWANTLDWAADDRRILLGHEGGIVSVAPERREYLGVTGAFAVKLDALRPSSMFLVDALILEPPPFGPRVDPRDLALMLESGRVVRLARIRGGPFPSHGGSFYASPVRWNMLLGSTPTGWWECAASEWAGASVRAVGSDKLWWVKDGVVCAMRPDSCKKSREIEPTEPVRWLGYDETHGDLLGVSGRRLWRRPEAGGEVAGVLTASSDVRAVLRSRTSASVALVTKDSLLVWNPQTREVRRFGARKLEACALFEGPDGRIVAQVERGVGLPPRLARADTTRGCLVPVETPEERFGTLAPAARGAWILLCVPGSSPPRTLHAYDVRSGRWHEVENPGLSAWEPTR